MRLLSYSEAMVRTITLLIFVLLIPKVALASDYSGLMPLVIAFVMLIGGVVAGFEWMLINAVMDRGEEAGEDTPEAKNKSRFGCGLGTLLWIVNSLIVYFILRVVWG